MSSRFASFFSAPVKLFHRRGKGSLALRVLACTAAAAALIGTVRYLDNDIRDKSVWTAVTGYDRSDSMEELDLNALTQTVNEVLDEPYWQDVQSNWSSLDEEARLEALQRLSDTFMSHYASLGVEPVKLKAFHTAPVENADGTTSTTGGQHVYGRWGTPRDSRIELNFHPEVLKIRGDSFVQMAGTVIHEASHSVQYQLADQFVFDHEHQEGSPLHDDAEDFHRGRVNYVGFYEDQDAYHSNPLEIQAFGNGDSFRVAVRQGERVRKFWQDNNLAGDPIRSLLDWCLDEHRPAKTLSVRYSDIADAVREAEEDTPAAPATPYQGM
ncbi:MAG: hypothetical protein Alpg2KO_13380 [Alphaproteobacteria bacterium]